MDSVCDGEGDVLALCSLIIRHLTPIPLWEITGKIYDFVATLGYFLCRSIGSTCGTPAESDSERSREWGSERRL